MQKKVRFRALLPYACHQWRWLVAILLLTALSSGAVVLQPWPMKLLVDYALGDAPVTRALDARFETLGIELTPKLLVIVSAVASVFLFALNSAVSVALSLSWSMAGQRMVYELAGDLFARLQRLSLLFHSRQSVGDSLSRLTNDTWCLYSVMDGLLIAPIKRSITLVAMVCVGFTLDPLLAGLALTVAPLLAIASRVFGSRLKQRSKSGHEAKSKLLSFVHQTLGAIPVVQTFGTDERNTGNFRNLADQVTTVGQRGSLVAGAYGLVNGLITTGGMAIVLYVGGTRVLSGAIPLGTLLIFIAYVRQMQSASLGLIKIFTKLKAAEASIDRVMEILESDDSVKEQPGAKRLPTCENGQGVHVRLQNVTFGYNPSRPVLNDISLEAYPGEVVALVGPTGAGKSTLASLVPRFFDPWQGSVLFNGIDIRTVQLDSLRSQIAVVLQEPFLLPLSIADNIAYGRPGASRDEIIKAAEAAQADAFIRRLPQGYETVIGERGVTLSGGERQRLSIARALLKDAPILILDEPTAALDPQTESSLIQSFQRLMQGRTTFVIAHRLSTIRHAHRIAVLDRGQLVESGTHDALLKDYGLYRTLYSRQFGDDQIKVLV